MKAGGWASFAIVERRIGYSFRSRDLLRTAFTHGSALAAGRTSYQRFEFLGDRVLGLAVAEMLVAAFPAASEGELSPRFAELVRKETCAEVATALDLGDALLVGGNKAHRAAVVTTNVLGDICEALIGAIFLDGGYEPARDFVERNWRERMHHARASRRDAKTSLQEWAHKKATAPVYRIADRRGPAHETVFVVDVTVPPYLPAQGEGRTRREAEQAAAAALLVREGVWTAAP